MHRMYYQPRVDLPTIAINSVELLTRGGQVQTLNTTRVRQRQAMAPVPNIQPILKKPTDNKTGRQRNKVVMFESKGAYTEEIEKKQKKNRGHGD